MSPDLPSNSGFLISSSEKISAQFSDYTELPCKGHNLIYKAKRYGKWHILKGLKPQFRLQPFYQELLRKEFELGVMLTHPNIVTVMSFEDDETVGRCIVMEYIDGVTLAEFLESKPARKLISKVLNEILAAMAYYHSKQVMHRDLKPSNILITLNGNNVKIIDFGLSDADSYVALKQPAGTLRYAAPEQLQEDQPVDCRTDLYALGKMLEYDFPNTYNWLAYKCIKYNPEQRPDNAEQVQKIIRHRQILWRSCAITVASVAVAAILTLTLRPLLSDSPSPTAQNNATPQHPATPETIHDTVINVRTDTIIKEADDGFKPGSKEDKLLKQLEKEMSEHFKPALQELKSGKYQWRDEIGMLTSNYAIDINFIKPLTSQVPVTSHAYTVLHDYFIELFNHYYNIIQQYGEKLPSYLDTKLSLIDQYDDKEITKEEYLKKLDALGPDPNDQWTYNSETKKWSKKGWK